MYGRLQKKFVIKICVFLFCLPIISYGDNIYVNGYPFDDKSSDHNKGIRLQGIGDFFFKSKSYAKAVSYYEQALSILPKEADITFRLAEIYQYEKLWRLSILYYEETVKLLQQPVNFHKSQLNSYISKIRIAYIYHLQGNSKEAIQRLKTIRMESSLLESSYPEAWSELKIFDTIYPETAVRKDRVSE